MEHPLLTPLLMPSTIKRIPSANRCCIMTGNDMLSPFGLSKNKSRGLPTLFVDTSTRLHHGYIKYTPGAPANHQNPLHTRSLKLEMLSMHAPTDIGSGQLKSLNLSFHQRLEALLGAHPATSAPLSIADLPRLDQSPQPCLACLGTSSGTIRSAVPPTDSSDARTAPSSRAPYPWPNWTPPG